MTITYDNKLCEHSMNDGERALYEHSTERPDGAHNGPTWAPTVDNSWPSIGIQQTTALYEHLIFYDRFLRVTSMKMAKFFFPSISPYVYAYPYIYKREREAFH